MQNIDYLIPYDVILGATASLGKVLNKQSEVMILSFSSFLLFITKVFVRTLNLSVMTDSESPFRGWSSLSECICERMREQTGTEHVIRVTLRLAPPRPYSMSHDSSGIFCMRVFHSILNVPQNESCFKILNFIFHLN